MSPLARAFFKGIAFEGLAFFTIVLIWSSLSPPDDWIAIDCSLFVALSLAET